MKQIYLGSKCQDPLTIPQRYAATYTNMKVIGCVRSVPSPFLLDWLREQGINYEQEVSGSGTFLYFKNDNDALFFILTFPQYEHKYEFV